MQKKCINAFSLFLFYSVVPCSFPSIPVLAAQLERIIAITYPFIHNIHEYTIAFSSIALQEELQEGLQTFFYDNKEKIHRLLLAIHASEFLLPFLLPSSPLFQGSDLEKTTLLARVLLPFLLPFPKNRSCILHEKNMIQTLVQHPQVQKKITQLLHAIALCDERIAIPSETPSVLEKTYHLIHAGIALFSLLTSTRPWHSPLSPSIAPIIAALFSGKISTFLFTIIENILNQTIEKVNEAIQAIPESTNIALQDERMKEATKEFFDRFSLFLTTKHQIPPAIANEFMRGKELLISLCALSLPSVQLHYQLLQEKEKLTLQKTAVKNFFTDSAIQKKYIAEIIIPLSEPLLLWSMSNALLSPFFKNIINHYIIAKGTLCPTIKKITLLFTILSLGTTIQRGYRTFKKKRVERKKIALIKQLLDMCSVYHITPYETLVLLKAIKEKRGRKTIIKWSNHFLSSLSLLCKIAAMLSAGGFSFPTITHFSGEHPGKQLFFSAKDFFHPGITPSVKNNIHLGRTNKKYLMVTGPHGSGKTMLLKSIISLLFWGNIGIVPAKNCSYSFFDDLFQNIVVDQESGLSTQIKELTFLKEIKNKNHQNNILFIDEIFSTTTENNLSPFVQHYLIPLLSENNLGLFTTNATAVIAALCDVKQQLCCATMIVQEDAGNFIFTYTLIDEEQSEFKKHNWWLTKAATMNDKYLHFLENHFFRR